MTQLIRATLLDSTDDLTTISEHTGIPISVLSRLASGKTLPSGATIDALAEHFGLALVPIRKPSMTNTTISTKKTAKRTTRKGI